MIYDLISSKLLTLGIVYASMTLLSLNRSSLGVQIFVFKEKSIASYTTELKAKRCRIKT